LGFEFGLMSVTPGCLVCFAMMPRSGTSDGRFALRALCEHYPAGQVQTTPNNRTHLLPRKNQSIHNFGNGSKTPRGGLQNLHSLVRIQSAPPKKPG
jgi:hypothetical protein